MSLVVDINFTGTYTPPVANVVNLNFGPVIPPLPDPKIASVYMSVGAARTTAGLLYASNTSRPFGPSVRAAWETATQNQVTAAAVYEQSQKLRTLNNMVWDGAIKRPRVFEIVLRDLNRSRSAVGVPYEFGARISRVLADRWVNLSRSRSANELRWQSAARIEKSWQDGYKNLFPLKRFSQLPWEVAAHRNKVIAGSFQRAASLNVVSHLPWEWGRHPGPGREPNPPLPPPVPQYVPTADLNFQCRWSPFDPFAVMLNFGRYPCSPTGGFVPVLKVYFVSNYCDVVLLPSGTPIPVKSINISVDVNSWAWSFTASAPMAALDMIAPSSSGVAQIQVTVNGQIWKMLVETYSVQREFGRSSITFGGRSVTAFLAEPYAPKRSFVQASDFTARQLAEAEITRAGLVTGYTLEWNIADWLIPSGVGSFDQKSPVQVVSSIVEAAGGALQSHPANKTLIAIARYPSMPSLWNTLTPDLTLPIDVMKTLGMNWSQKPAYNAVVVSGERQGVTGLIRLSGTAGDQQAQMVTDALITHADAARARGLTILADTGKQARVTIEVPMLASIGLLNPGKLIAVTGDTTAWRGLVRSTGVAAAWDNAQSLTVRQSVELERHFA